ncbi:hypothetical protein LCGC14_0702080 [marine sediment metagenome]|uniref:Uncharacterized protein n=1 Tax=marine sediment metagenome TaxID=412755 RepID=A0A0F9T3C4_9ZZZZ
MAKVFVYTGLPGSGKSSVIKKRHPNAKVFSVDDYFMVGDKYEFDPTKIGEAHADCFRRYIDCVRKFQWIFDYRPGAEMWDPRAFGYHHDVVVDNTNTTTMEIAPYMLAAAAFYCEAEVITIKCAPQVAFDRNIHGVPLEAHQGLRDNLNARELPAWWTHTEIDMAETSEEYEEETRKTDRRAALIKSREHIGMDLHDITNACLRLKSPVGDLGMRNKIEAIEVLVADITRRLGQ